MAATFTYTVRSGDSLSKIAQSQMGDLNRWKEIAVANGIADPYIIFPGQVLTIPYQPEEISVAPPIRATEPTQTVQASSGNAANILVTAFFSILFISVANATQKKGRRKRRR